MLGRNSVEDAKQIVPGLVSVWVLFALFGNLIGFTSLIVQGARDS